MFCCKHSMFTAICRSSGGRSAVFKIFNCRGASSRAYRGRSRVILGISNTDSAQIFVNKLSPSERNLLQDALRKQRSAQPVEVEAAFQSAVPFIGFGFLDNAVMIIAGEYIDITIGAALGISTMAAAALGNLVSDVSGMGLAHYVEAAAEKLGFQGPRLSSKQLELPRTRLATNVGRSIGLSLGCILGMFPLLLYTFGDHEEKEHKEESS